MLIKNNQIEKMNVSVIKKITKLELILLLLILEIPSKNKMILEIKFPILKSRLIPLEKIWELLRNTLVKLKEIETLI